MLFDSHSHTEFSADSEMKATEALAAAQQAGVGLVFTEHLDLDYPGELDFTFSPEKYWQSYESWRGENLQLGVEVGMQAATLERSREFVSRVPFDLVIGSQHMQLGQDIYYEKFYEGKSKREVYACYYDDMAKNVRSHDFIDVLGHIDYIARYAPYDNSEVEYASFVEPIDEVLRAVIDTNTVMELNTRRLKNCRALKELVPIYRRYVELGGKYVTFGSDAHTADAIAINFKTARDFTAMLGLQIVTFSKRQMVLCK